MQPEEILPLDDREETEDDDVLWDNEEEEDI